MLTPVQGIGAQSHMLAYTGLIDAVDPDSKEAH
jgi:hypothetical protein